MTKTAEALLDLVMGAFFVQTTRPPRWGEWRSASSSPMYPIVSQICHAFAEPVGLGRT